MKESQLQVTIASEKDAEILCCLKTEVWGHAPSKAQKLKEVGNRIF